MRKILVSFALILLVSLSMLAQTIQFHTVRRGETMKSIAKSYGVSVNDLRQANSSAKGTIYEGMKLIIPSKTKVQGIFRKANSDSPNNVAVNTSSTKKVRNKPAKTKDQTVHKSSFSSGFSRGDFTSVSITFGHDLSDLVGVTYGIQGQYFLKNGLGATLTVGANYGLEDDADIVFRVGPSYVYPITNMFYVMGTVCYSLTMGDYKGNKGMISGASAIPTIGLSFNHIKIGINGDFHWRNGGEFGPGAYLSVGYSF